MDHAHLAALFGGIAAMSAAAFGLLLQRRRVRYRSRPYTYVGPPRCEAHGLNFEHYLDVENDRRICHPPKCRACPRSLRQHAEHVTGGAA